jgi:hypothetical protein
MLDPLFFYDITFLCLWIIVLLLLISFLLFFSKLILFFLAWLSSLIWNGLTYQWKASFYRCSKFPYSLTKSLWVTSEKWFTVPWYFLSLLRS